MRGCGPNERERERAIYKYTACLQAAECSHTLLYVCTGQTRFSGFRDKPQIRKSMEVENESLFDLKCQLLMGERR